VRFDLVAQDEIGAGIAGLGLAELVAESGQGLGPPGAESGSSRMSSWPGPGQMSPEVVRASRMSAYASSPTRA
jgi:hypothetical protein